jgi:hypothetical protein
MGRQLGDGFHGRRRAVQRSIGHLTSSRPVLPRWSSSPDLPDRPFECLRVQPSSQKYFCFHLAQITGLSRAIPFPIEGRFAIVTNVGFGMRWTRRIGRRTMPLADGEVVWF